MPPDASAKPSGPSTPDVTLDPATLREKEQALIRERRRRLGLEKDPAKAPPLGLALSGGGIRSATLNLGILQAIARLGLLRRVDYLSTVSGGGYVGAFLGALLRAPSRPDRPKGTVLPDATETPRPDPLERGYALAERVLTSGDTGAPEFRAPELPAGLARPIFHPVRWLRENGRYLAPTSSGDWLFAIAYYLRGLAGTHYVGAVLAMLVFSLWAAMQWWWGRGLEPEPWTWDAWVAGRDWPTARWNDMEPMRPSAGPSPVAWLLLPCSASLVALTLAYWVTTAEPYTRAQRRERWVARAALPFAAAAFLAFFALSSLSGGACAGGNLSACIGADLAGLRDVPEKGFTLGQACLTLSVLCAAGLACSLASGWHVRQVEASRRRLTRWLSGMLRLTVVVAALAAVDTVARYILLHGISWTWLTSWIGASSLLGALLRWALPKTAGAWLDLARRFTAPLALAVAVAVCAGLAILYALLVYQAAAFRSASAPWLPLLVLTVACAVACLILLCAPGFLNLSTFHNFYAARLTRAYLGAANPERLSRQKDGAMEAGAWVQDGHPQDMWTTDAYFGLSGEKGAGADEPPWPLHLINVTLNEQRGGTSDITQRDRKGVNFSVGPVCLSVDGRHYDWDTPQSGGGQTLRAATRPLKLGNWIAISGAAFSTGVGSETRLGFAMLAALLNARLGYWWLAPACLHDSEKVDPGSREWKHKLRASTFACLLAEMTGGFWGRRSERWYLSDGGHFENTGAYELIRRRVPLIVMSDCGADPDYRFDDLANLARKVRIDFGAEVRLLDHAELDMTLPQDVRSAYGTRADFARARLDPTAPSPCALLAHVTFQDDPKKAPLELTILKPARLPDAPPDLAHYAASHPRFPQESTVDQFFDEAQWESYRLLGERIAMRALGVAALHRERTAPSTPASAAASPAPTPAPTTMPAPAEAGA